jgi:alcohol dehydrogenase/propanol-preferring alcohol dehydrogenase
MRLWAVVENGKPLECLEVETPKPQGSEVVVEVTHCGVCHSDLHFWKGTYDMGGGQVLKITDRGVELPRAPGHEVLGKVVAVGPDAQGVTVDDKRIVYPWIGCGECERCKAGEDNLCDKQRSIGVVRHGGFSSHVVVPHPRYLFEYGNLDPAVATTFSCSGITVYSAIKKLGPLEPDKPIVLIGAGGLGLAAIQMLKALGYHAIISVDLDPAKRKAALDAGATAAVDGGGEGVVARIVEAAGGLVMGAIDFVNNGKTTATALDCLARNGKLILVGVAGGDMVLSVAGMIFRPRGIIGSGTGSQQELREVIELAKSGKLESLPVERMPKDSANDALMKLKSGAVIGRLVLEGA